MVHAKTLKAGGKNTPCLLYLSLHELTKCLFLISAFSSTCGQYWSLHGGFIDKPALLELDFPTLLQLLMENKLLSFSEYHELMVLREKLEPWDVRRRLACLVTWKPVHLQNAFLRILNDVACQLTARLAQDHLPRSEWIHGLIDCSKLIGHESF